MKAGELLIAYAWWEGLPGWAQIVEANEWPPQTRIVIQSKIENTGDVSAVFSARLITLPDIVIAEGTEASLEPGQSFFSELPQISLGGGTYQLVLQVLADGDVVAEYPFTVVTEAPPVAGAPGFEWMGPMMMILMLGLMAPVLTEGMGAR